MRYLMDQRKTIIIFAGAVQTLVLIAILGSVRRAIFPTQSWMPSSQVGYQEMPCDPFESLGSTPFEEHSNLNAEANDYKNAWKAMIQRDLSPYKKISRQGVYNAASMLGRTGAVLQITSDKRIYVVSPPRPKEMRDQDKGVQQNHATFTLGTIMMLQLMLRDMEVVPNVTLIYGYEDSCLSKYSLSRVLNELDSREFLQDVQTWEPWLRKYRSRDTSSESPLEKISPALFWARPSHGEPASTCLGLSMPNYDTSIYDGLLEALGELDKDPYGKIPWHKRKQKIMWRGSYFPDSRPVPPIIANPNNSIRARIAKVGKEYRDDLMDIALTPSYFGTLYGIPKELFGELVNNNEEASNYRYLLNVDGLGPSSRLRNQLLSGSLIFKVDSPLNAYYMEDMKPWVHYIPVSWAEVETDLPTKLQWAIKHDAAAYRIARTAFEFAKERLTDKSTAWYMQEVIKAISKLQQAAGEDFELIPGAVPFCCDHLELAVGHFQKLWKGLCANWTASAPLSCPGKGLNVGEVGLGL